MVCARDLRLSFLYSLVHSAFSRTRALTRRAMGFLDCRFCTSTNLGGRATQSRLATAQLAADPGNRYPVPLRDLFRGLEGFIKNRIPDLSNDQKDCFLGFFFIIPSLLDERASHKFKLSFWPSCNAA